MQSYNLPELGLEFIFKLLLVLLDIHLFKPVGIKTFKVTLFNFMELIMDFRHNFTFGNIVLFVSTRNLGRHYDEIKYK